MSRDYSGPRFAGQVTVTGAISDVGTVTVAGNCTEISK